MNQPRLVTTSQGDAISTTWDFEAAPSPRQCGGCTLCCKLLPIAAFEKPAGLPCPHQRHGKGCRIYERRPLECGLWSCRWLSAPEETAGMRRPDRARYAIDPMLDEIRITPNPGVEGTPQTYPSLQVWCDPAHRDALVKDPELLGYLERMRQAHGVTAATLRWSNTDATVLLYSQADADAAPRWQAVSSTVNPKIGNFAKLSRRVQERLR